MDNTRFLARRSLLATRTLQTLSLSLMAIPLCAVPCALAQAPRARVGAAPASPAGAAAAVAGEAVAPRTDGVNVLILAFDDLSTPLSQPAVGAAPAAAGLQAGREPEAGVGNSLPELPTPNLPVPAEDAATLRVPSAPAMPGAPAPAAEELPAIRPAAAGLRGAIQYRALAQQKDKKPRKKKGLTDEDFRPEPIPLPPLRSQGPAPGNEDNVVAGSLPGSQPGGVSPGAGTPGSGGAGVGSISPGAPTSPFVLDSSGGGMGASSLLGPGRAQAVAAPLRRALARAGFGDVLAVAPGNVALARVIETNGLSPRVLEAARVGLAQLAASPGEGAAGGSSTSGATGAAGSAPTVGPAQNGRWAGLYQAAARVGQALGYRVVVVLGVAPRGLEGGGTAAATGAATGAGTAGGATFALAVVDALREAGEPIVFDEDGDTMSQANESAALTASSIVARSLNALPTVSNAEKVALSTSYMSRARAAYESKDYAGAQDYLSQVLAFEPNRAEARLMMADVLSQFDADAAARAYTAALKLEGVDGPTWARAAIAFTVGSAPSWPRALEAARKALSLGYESAELRQAMATAQMGRAVLFRDAERYDKAEEADAEAQTHLARARFLAPGDPEPSRLMATYLVQQGRSRDALRLLDEIAGQYPDDAELQTLYAGALFDTGGRDEDAFVAWARVWRLAAQPAVPVDAAHYRRLSDGFDQRLSTLGKRAAQLASSVAAGTADRGTSLLQMSRYREDMDVAIGAVRVMQPAYDNRVANTHSTRVFAANLMSQAMTFYTNYLETGQERMRQQATSLQTQAILMLNTARTG